MHFIDSTYKIEKGLGESTISKSYRRYFRLEDTFLFEHSVPNGDVFLEMPKMAEASQCDRAVQCCPGQSDL